MDKKTLFTLIDKYLDGIASHAERTLLEAYYNRLEKKGASRVTAEEKDALKENMYRNIIAARGPQIIPLYKRPVFRIAAVSADLITEEDPAVFK
jgi:transmembrane sensor